MPLDLQEMRLIPGFNSEKTPALNQSGIVNGQFVRFRDGLVEKLGGWAKFLSVNVGSIPRALLAWLDLNNTERLAIASTLSLKVAVPATSTSILTDITPQELTTSGLPNFSATSGSPVITIDDANISNVSTLDWVFIRDPVSVGGIIIFGTYQVVNVLGSSTYQITASLNATANSAFVFPPAPPSLSAASGGSLAATTYFVKVAYINPAGETIASPESSLAVAASHVLVVTSPAAAGTATGWNVYVSTSTGTEQLQNSTEIPLGTNWTEPTSGLVTNLFLPFNFPPAINMTGGGLPYFGVTNGNNTVDVFLPNHGNTAGEDIYFLDATTFAGVTISGDYTVQTVPDASDYSLSASTLATANAVSFMNGGNVMIEYFVGVGPQPTSAGYGTGPYGSGGYGIGVAPTGGAGNPIVATDYSLINFGEDLLANPAGNAIFQWGPEVGLQNARLLGTGPIVADGIFLAQPQQIVVAWGASFNGVPSPLRLVWSDAGDFTDWTPTSTNFAGGFTISRGSRIVGCIQAPNQFLVLTDIGCWSGQYIGQPLVFSIIEIMEGCGLIGRKAIGIAGTTAYWMSQKQPFQLAAGGVPMPLSCRVWDYFFQQVDKTNLAKVQFFANSQFNEIGWYFPLAGGNGECTNYIKYNTVEGEWDTGPLGRSCWIDQSILGGPIGGNQNGFIYQHEISPDADGVAINAVIVTGDYTIGKGEEFAVVDLWIPDAIYGVNGGPQTANLLFTFYPKNFPSDGLSAPVGPFVATAATPFLEPRFRGRQVAVQMESQDLGSFWRIGLNRFRAAPDGRNPA